MNISRVPPSEANYYASNALFPTDTSTIPTDVNWKIMIDSGNKALSSEIDLVENVCAENRSVRRDIYTDSHVIHKAKMM